MKRLGAIVAVTTLFCSSALAQTGNPEKARLGLIMWAAFQCALFAELSGNKNEQERLVMVGLKSGRDFLEALKAGQVSRDNLNKEVPIGVTMLLGGPSPDFTIGRIFEYASRDAYDAAVKDDIAAGVEASVRDALKKTRAMTSFENNNCVLIK
jgi:hypothetical protein